MEDFYNDLMDQVKLSIQLPKEYTDINSYLYMLIKSSKIYIDNSLDNEQKNLNNDLYKFAIIQLSVFKYLNVDNDSISNYPIYITGAINQLKYT